MLSKYLPSPDRPLLIQRFKENQERSDLWERTFEVLRENRECCDEIWFSTGSGYRPLDVHRVSSAKMAECAEQLRAIGIIPSIQIQSTLGHGDLFRQPATLNVMTWGGYMGKHGEQCKYVSCPRQEGFLEYFRELARIYAAWHPGSMWIDDDLRLNNHYPATEYGGCYCPLCMKLFSQQEGREYSREKLVAECETDKALEARWLEFGKESLIGVARTIAEAAHKVSPETRLCLQHGDQVFERNAIFDVLKEISGKRSASRPGAGTYGDHNPYDIIWKALQDYRQAVLQSGYDVLDQVCAEIESCPRVFTSKSSRGHRLESMLYLAMGMDSLSYFITSANMESPEWYGRNLLAPLAKEAPAYREFARLNEGTVPGGMGFCIDIDFDFARQLTNIGVPIAAYSDLACLKLIDAGSLRKLDDEGISKELTGNLLLDGEAVKVLAERGLSHLIGGITAEPLDAWCLEAYTESELSSGLEIKIHNTLRNNRSRLLVPADTSVRVLGEYIFEGYPERHGIATLIFTREDGSKVAILGHTGFDLEFLSSSRVQFIYNLVDAATDGKMPALPMEPVQCMIVPRITDTEELRSVTIMNTVIGEQHPFEIRLRGVPAGTSSIKWHVPGAMEQDVVFRKDGNDIIVKVPEIDGWDIGFLKFN